MRKYHFSLLFIVINILGLQACTAGTIQTPVLHPGIYDGRIGNKEIILVSESETDDSVSGYFFYKRKKAVEETHRFSLYQRSNKLIFVSEEVSGNIIGDIEQDAIEGKIHLAKKSIFFWKNRRNFNIIGRIDGPEVVLKDRYKKPVYSDIDVKKDIIYGSAVGYWTETPYLDDPYIEMLARGMANLFKGEKELELKMDIYTPASDSFYNRPLLLLMHGGGFYVGNKQSETEEKLATRFASMGYVVASIDYRMGFKMKPEEIERTGYKAIQDVHAALRFLSHHSKEYGINPNQVYVAGTSAGAIAALNIAFLQNEERPLNTYELHSAFKLTKKEDLGSIESSGNLLTDSFQIKAVGNMWGALSDIEILDADERIPVISFHGDADKIVPFGHDYPFKNTFRLNRLVMEKMYGSKLIHERLDQMKVDNKLIVFNGKGHEPQLDNFKSTNTLLDLIMDELTTFLFRQTATQVELDSSLINLHPGKRLHPLITGVNNGELVKIEAIGGVPYSNIPNDSRIIWLENAPVHKIIVFTKNEFDAWNRQEIDVKITANSDQ